jgi:cysteine-rich repeat protein
VAFPDNGQWTAVSGSSPPSPGVYAVSVAGVHPTTCVTWWQAAEACRLSGKRRLTNLEWQDAAADTPDPGDDGNFTSGDGCSARCQSELCGGDCYADVEVTVDEIITAVNIALGIADVSTCSAGDPNGDDEITVDEIVVAVNNALNECSG